MSKFIYYKDEQMVNLYCVDNIGKNRTEAPFLLSVYLIIFHMENGGVKRWQFSTIEERDAVYNKILETYGEEIKID